MFAARRLSAAACGCVFRCLQFAKGLLQFAVVVLRVSASPRETAFAVRQVNACCFRVYPCDPWFKLLPLSAPPRETAVRPQMDADSRR